MSVVRPDYLFSYSLLLFHINGYIITYFNHLELNMCMEIVRKYDSLYNKRHINDGKLGAIVCSYFSDTTREISNIYNTEDDD